MKKNLSVVIVIIIVTALSVILFSLNTYKNNLQKTLSADIYEQLTELSINNAKSIEAKLNDQLEIMEALASYISEKDFYSEEVLSILNKTVDNYGFLRCAIAFSDGVSITHDSKNATNTANDEFIIKGFQGKSSITGPRGAVVDPAVTVILLTVPIINDDVVRAVLTCTYETQYLNRVFKMTNFEGKGYSYISDKSGNIISAPSTEGILHDSDNIINFLEENSTTSDYCKEIVSNMNNMCSGSVLIDINGIKKYMNYQSIGINDWYIFSVAPNIVLEHQLNSIFSDVYNLTIIIILTFIILTILISTFIYLYQHKTKKELRQLAYYDNLTNISNKNFFEISASKILDSSLSDYAYIILNVNKFKVINDIFGFSQGDSLLKFIAKTISKETDSNELCSRFDADNFHILFSYNSLTVLEERLKTIADCISEYPFDKNVPHKLSIGYGVYVIDDKTKSVSYMGDKARMALSKIKGVHSPTINFYNNEIIKQLIYEHDIENSMKNALDNGEMLLYIQGKHSASKYNIIGGEALVRWLSPTKGMIMPDNFIPLFEKNGFIIELDMYMVDITCKTLRNWLDKGIKVVPISVNQSRQCLYHPNYTNELVEIIKKYNISTSLIELEITERAFFEDENTLINIIHQLHDLGFMVAMDDFGAGYSSLNMLQNINVDVLKIDKNFFTKSINSKRGKKIVSNIVLMANDLEIEVVAEGIETIEQLEFLTAINCNIVQGYYFSKPIIYNEFEKKLIE